MPKTQIKLEYSVNCSPTVLYERLTTPSGLSEWFADDVITSDGKTFIFKWDGDSQEATILQNRDRKMVRFVWVHDKTYFEFRVVKHELTGDVALVVIDFAEAGEEAEMEELWNSQIADLKRILGC
ncbi:MAG: SRPBCC domain-containing protein [Bacteroidales bacterium]|jgi:uncharacterized protein YndB with AHSA1/START domain|nr:SRPBCC domain-containing protein [Bacteroidales bacterium]